MKIKVLGAVALAVGADRARPVARDLDEAQPLEVVVQVAGLAVGRGVLDEFEAVEADHHQAPLGQCLALQESRAP